MHLRKIALLCAAVIAVLALILAVPFLVPLETYRGPLQRAASTALGREVRIAGPLHLTLYPTIGVSLADVSVANAPGAREPQMVGVGTVIAGVKLGPLFSGDLEIEQLVLQKPIIHLEIAKDGTPNWALAAKAPGAKNGQGGQLGRISVWDVSVDGGTVTYFDARTGHTQAVEDATLSLQILQGEAAGLNAPLTVTGTLNWRGQPLTIDGKIDDPAAVLKGNGTHAHISFGAPIMNANFDGTFAADGRIAGDLKLGAPSLRNAAAWIGYPLPAGNGFGLVALESNVTLDAGRFVLSSAQVAFDSMHISGDISVDTRPTVPAIKAVIAIDRLDLNPYLAPGASDDTVKARAAAKAAPDAPLSLGGLKAVDADLLLNVGSLALQHMKIDRSTIGVVLHGGVLTADLKNVALYGGTGKGVLTVDTNGAVPGFRETMDVSGLKAQPFLKDLIGVDRIDGTGAVHFEVASEGSNQKTITAALSGKGDMKFTNGSIHGADLVAISRVLQSVLTAQVLGDAIGDKAKTEYSVLGESFTINHGVVHTADMKMVNPSIQITGAGDVNLAAQTIDFRVEPKAIAGGKGQVPGLGLVDTGVPFTVKGPWTHPSYRPDLKALATGLMKTPFKALKSLFGGK